MIRTLLWKEYREQRMTIVALTALAIALLVSVQLLGEPARSDTSQYGMVAACLVWMTGLILGAQPFAGEIENRTLAWLDSQPVRRREIGRTKIAFAVCGTIAQAVLLISIGAITGWIEERWFMEILLFVTALGLSGLGCGLWGSSFGSSGLVAVGWALAIQGIVSAVAIGLVCLYRTVLNRPVDNRAMLIAAAVCLPIPFFAAGRRFTRLDRQRRKTPEQFGRIGQSWRSLIWLAWRQSRLLFWGLTIAGLFAAVLLSFDHLWQYWPPVGLAFGIIAGVGAFAADRPGDAYRFIGDRRLPFTEAWLVKCAVRLGLALVPTLVYASAILLRLLSESYRFAETGNKWLEPSLQRLLAAVEFNQLWLGPIYGVALGVFLGFICRKGAVAVVLAAILGSLVLIVWWPSIIITGLHVRQWIVPPLVLIGATCWAMRPWTTGRLGAWRPAHGLAAAAAISIVAMLGGLWYRVAEVPLRTDPFDVNAFVASLPTPEQNVAGRKIAALLRDFPQVGSTQHESKPNGDVQLAPLGRAGSAVNKQLWPADDVELDRWLDELISNPWFSALSEALGLPPGMIDGLQPQAESRDYSLMRNASNAATIFNARALQMVRRNKPVDAFDSVFEVFALSRQLRSNANWQSLQVAIFVEQSALTILPHIVEIAASQPELLVQALSRLRKHNATIPPIGDALRVDYCNSLMQASLANWGLHGSPVEPRQELTRIAAQVPWELARTKGILATLFAGYIRTSELPFAEAVKRIALARESKNDPSMLRVWTPASTEPSHARSEYLHMHNLLLHSIWSETHIGRADLMFGWEFAVTTKRRGAELQLALQIYQLRHGKAPAALADLVPGILPELPLDPYCGDSFHYRVSEGERIQVRLADAIDVPQGFIIVAPGQGIVWSVGPDGVNSGATLTGTPIWQLWGWWPSKNGGDVIFLVPMLKKP